MLFRQPVVKGPIRHSEGPASTPYFAKLAFSETLPDTSTLPPCSLFVKAFFSAAGSGQVLAGAGSCAAMRAAAGSGRDTTPPPRLKAGSAPQGAGRGHAGSGRQRQARPSGRGKRKEARMCGPLSENRSVTCTSCPRRRTFSLPRPAAFVKREAAPRRRPHRAQAGHCAARPPRSRFSRRPRGGGAPRAGSCTMPEGWPGAAAPCAAVPGVPGKALPVPALPEMTPGRPRGAGHPLDALGWPRWGQPPAVCSVCLPRLRGPEITGPLRCGGRRVPQRATLRKGLDPALPRAGGRGAGAPLRRLSRCGYPRSAPPHCPAQRGARRHAACGSSRGPS